MLHTLGRSVTVTAARPPEEQGSWRGFFKRGDTVCWHAEGGHPGRKLERKGAKERGVNPPSEAPGFLSTDEGHLDPGPQHPSSAHRGKPCSSQSYSAHAPQSPGAMGPRRQSTFKPRSSTQCLGQPAPFPLPHSRRLFQTPGKRTTQTDRQMDWAEPH